MEHCINFDPQEFALAEMEYQVDELLFRMSALSGGVSLPSKGAPCYTTDSDGTYGAIDDMFSFNGSGSNEKNDDELNMSRLLQLKNIGFAIKDETVYSRYDHHAATVIGGTIRDFSTSSTGST